MSQSEVNQSLDGVSVMLCTPVRGGTSPSYNDAVEALMAWCRAQGVPIARRVAAEAPVDFARDGLAAEFLAATTDVGKPYTHCLMIDSGVGFGVESAKKLLMADEDFTAVAVPLRRSDIEKAAKTGDARNATVFAIKLTQYSRETGKMRVVQKNGAALAEIDGIGAAMICVRRKVYERMFDAHPELRHRGGFRYFEPSVLDDDGESHVTKLRRAVEKALAADSSTQARDMLRAALAVDHEQYEARGEDISFSMRWRRLHTEDKPAQVWMLCDAPVVHEGHGMFTGNIADALGF